MRHFEHPRAAVDPASLPRRPPIAVRHLPSVPPTKNNVCGAQEAKYKIGFHARELEQRGDGRSRRSVRNDRRSKRGGCRRWHPRMIWRYSRSAVHLGVLAIQVYFENVVGTYRNKKIVDIDRTRTCDSSESRFRVYRLNRSATMPP
jgi:hypothetical protein